MTRKFIVLDKSGSKVGEHEEQTPAQAARTTARASNPNDHDGPFKLKVKDMSNRTLVIYKCWNYWRETMGARYIEVDIEKLDETSL